MNWDSNLLFHSHVTIFSFVAEAIEYTARKGVSDGQINFRKHVCIILLFKLYRRDDFYLVQRLSEAILSPVNCSSKMSGQGWFVALTIDEIISSYIK